MVYFLHLPTGFLKQGKRTLVSELSGGIRNRRCRAVIDNVNFLHVVVDCGSLPDPLHGKKTRETKTTFGGRVDFKCTNKRYTFTGSKRRFCQANGKWSGKPAVCKGTLISITNTI